MSDASPRGLVRWSIMLGGVETDRADRACVDESFHLGGPGGIEHIQAAADVDVVKIRCVASPKSVNRCHVENHPAATGGIRHSRCVSQISYYLFNLKFFEVGW